MRLIWLAAILLGSSHRMKKICRLSGTKQTSRRRNGLLTVVLWMLLCWGARGQQNSSLAWDPSQSSCLAGYAVYSGTASGQYTSRFDAGTNTSVRLASLTGGQTNYFVVCGYNSVKVEGPPSSEVKLVVPATNTSGSTNITPPPPPIIPALAITPATNGKHVQIFAAAVSNQTWVLQSSTNLTNWSSLYTNQAGVALNVVIAVPTGQSWFYYRALSVTGAVNSSNVSSALGSHNVSANAVGFVTINAGHGYTILANPFDTGSNTVAALVPTAPAGTVLFEYTTGSGYTSNVFSGTGWNSPRALLNPGEGGFLYNPSKNNLRLLFAGRILSGTVTNAIPGGYSLASPMIPLANSLNTLPAANGDVIQLYQNKWISYTNVSGVWVGNHKSSPLVWEPGDAFFITKQGPANWVQTFSPAN
jgi:hypothetical protein